MGTYNLQSLNEEQIKPLLQTKGAVLVTAGAGSGKTRLLTHRIAYIIENGVNPYNILAITFTNKATNEMKERISSMCEGSNQIWISTFHSMCAKILRKEIYNIGYTNDFTIYSESDSEKVKKDILTELDEDDDKMKKLFSFHLSNWKNGVLSLEEYAKNEEDEDFEVIIKAIKRYEEILKENNALDFDDLLIKTYQLFKQCPQVLFYYANRFEYILVDEFQDTNVVQYELLKQLSSVHKNIFAVGDEDQCIYSWRGANFKNIFNFKKDFNDVKIFKLERNYRSTPNILNLANNLIKNNKERLEKKLWTLKSEGEKPVIYPAYDERDEAEFVAKTISNLLSQGYKLNDFAVLMRVNALSRSFEEAFLSYNIAHRIYGGFKFFERVEIKNIIAYLRLFVNPKDDVSFERIINFPRRGIGESGVGKIKQIAGNGKMLEIVLGEEIKSESAVYKKLQLFVDTFKNLEKLKKSLGLTEFVKNVITLFDIRSAFNPKIDEDFNKLMNIDSFIASVEEFEKQNEGATLSDYLESVTLISDVDSVGQEGSVTISTVHAVKGLEFKVVFVVGCEEGIFPGARSLGSNAGLEEERRLMYVAVTRAEERLFVTYCGKRYIYGQTRFEIPSRFCKELGLVKKEKIEEKKSNMQGFSVLNLFKKREEEEEKPKKDTSIYFVGQKVSHPRFGDGVIKSITDDRLVADIEFEGFGVKSLMLEIAPLEIL